MENVWEQQPTSPQAAHLKRYLSYVATARTQPVWPSSFNCVQIVSMGVMLHSNVGSGESNLPGLQILSFIPRDPSVTPPHPTPPTSVNNGMKGGGGPSPWLAGTASSSSPPAEHHHPSHPHPRL